STPLQALLSLHSIGVPTQWPALHAAPIVHTPLPSSQIVPSGSATCWQAPAWQLSAVHGLPSSQPAGVHTMTGPTGVQAGLFTGMCTHPLGSEQGRSVVHASPSSQFAGRGVPATHGFEPGLAPGLHVSTPSHARPSSQLIRAPVQTLLDPEGVQTSFTVQALPSSQVLPFSGALMQPSVPSHESSVHKLLSLQSSGGPAMQPSVESQVWGKHTSPPHTTGAPVHTCEALQVSVVPGPVQALPSLHAVPTGSGGFTQPPCPPLAVGSQASGPVQVLLSSQLVAVTTQSPVAGAHEWKPLQS